MDSSQGYSAAATSPQRLARSDADQVAVRIEPLDRVESRQVDDRAAPPSLMEM
ncbi:hypothetical protein [Streptomyces sp. KM273126]|uniref:hypothetical protein n=1 Tax=Streptomyces sp. KM273126 TaxID=2545247 RepID=UPI00215DB5DB|nr:hypothetical protein [Streptomyces sp. KM273126]